MKFACARFGGFHARLLLPTNKTKLNKTTTTKKKNPPKTKQSCKQIVWLVFKRKGEIWQVNTLEQMERRRVVNIIHQNNLKLT